MLINQIIVKLQTSTQATTSNSAIAVQQYAATYLILKTLLPVIGQNRLLAVHLLLPLLFVLQTVSQQAKHSFISAGIARRLGGLSAGSGSRRQPGAGRFLALSVTRLLELVVPLSTDDGLTLLRYRLVSWSLLPPLPPLLPMLAVLALPLGVDCDGIGNGGGACNTDGAGDEGATDEAVPWSCDDDTVEAELVDVARLCSADAAALPVLGTGSPWKYWRAPSNTFVKLTSMSRRLLNRTPQEGKVFRNLYESPRAFVVKDHRANHNETPQINENSGSHDAVDCQRTREPGRNINLHCL
ncbi:unnamed protein product, partial [Heterotrigona itama]